MKVVISLILIAFAATGCATLGPNQGSSAGVGSIDDATASSFPAPTVVFPPPAENTGPRIVNPGTGGPPIIGIPLGGGLFLPVSGGPPVFGIPTSP